MNANAQDVQAEAAPADQREVRPPRNMSAQEIMVLRSLPKRVDELLRRVREISERMDALEPSGLTETLQKMQQDVSAMHVRVQALIQRVTTATELMRFLSNQPPTVRDRFMRTLVHAFDEPDRWWRSRDKRSLQDWVEILKHYRPTRHADEA